MVGSSKKSAVQVWLMSNIRNLNPYCHGLKHFSSVTGGGSWSPRTQSAPDSTRRLIGGQNFDPVSLGIYTLGLWRKKVEKMSRSFTATVEKIFKNLENYYILPFKEIFTYKKICRFNFESLKLCTQCRSKKYQLERKIYIIGSCHHSWKLLWWSSAQSQRRLGQQSHQIREESP